MIVQNIVNDKKISNYQKKYNIKIRKGGTFYEAPRPINKQKRNNA